MTEDSSGTRSKPRGRSIAHVEYSDRFQGWVVLDGNFDIVEMFPNRAAAKRYSVEFAKAERWRLGILGRMNLWPQTLLGAAFGVSPRTVRDCIAMVSDSADS